MALVSEPPDLRTSFPILFGSRWQARGLSEAVASLDPGALCAEYARFRELAPRRSRVGKSYFVGHSGVPSASGGSNRLEEHCAIALVNLRRRWPRPEGGWFQLLDYQVPLKARQADARIGKIDLLGLADNGRLMIIELKVPGENGGRSDAPPTALMEGLRYAAVIEADFEAIADEVESKSGIKVLETPPIVNLLAPRAWWRNWLDLAPAGDWGPAFVRLAAAVEEQTGVTIECMALEDVRITPGLDGVPPRLEYLPGLYPVRPDEEPAMGDAMPMPP
jgi:hypothetical protein